MDKAITVAIGPIDAIFKGYKIIADVIVTG